MDGRRARLIDRPVLDNVPTLPTPATKPAQHRGRQLATGWAAVLAVGWPLTLLIGAVLEPAPVDPEAAVPVLVEVASLALFTALVTTAVTAARRHPAAAPAAVVTGLFAVAFSVTCPVSGHHAFGLWWIAQLGVMVTMLAVSVAAFGHRSRSTA